MTRLRSRTTTAAFILACALPLQARQAGTGAGSYRDPSRRDIVIDILGGGARDEAYLNGFRRALDGATITYHSSHPDAEDALLCRARRDAGEISWQGDTLPPAAGGAVYRFAWLAGLERRGWGDPNGVRTFHFSVNGAEYFSFRNRKDSTAGGWAMKRSDGAELEFRASFTDRFGDLFGMMYLTLPKERFAPGAPLTFSVRSEDAGAPEWFMVFRYAFNFRPDVRVEPAILKTAAGGALPVRVSVDNLHPGRRVRILDGEAVLIDTALSVGANIFIVPVGGGPGDRLVVSRVNGATVSVDTIAARSAAPLELWLIPHSHTDIGYTDLQPEVEKKHWRNLDLALDLVRRTKDYPAGSRFKWNMEVLWPLESYMEHAAPERRQEVVGAVREGSLGLNALLANPLTGLATAPEMDHYTEYARSLEAEYALDIPTAAVSDIPGFTWGIVPSLVRSGVRYFASAPNSGDRIGRVIEAQGDRPFWWESQSGEERVLFWVAGSSYAYFHEGTLPNLGREKLMKLLRKISASGYPYSIYFLPYTLGDNAGPDTGLPAFVKRWNEEYETPKLVIATHREMFREFERRHGKEIPVKRGDFTPYWEDGALSTAAETALNRTVVDRLLRGEALFSMRSPSAYPSGEYSDAWRLTTLWDEHTWGADISVSSPDSPKTTLQWGIKRGYVVRSDSISAALLGRAVRGGGAAAADSFTVFNTNSWARTDIVLLPPEQSRAGDLVTDGAGRVLASQRLGTGELAVLVENIAPLSSLSLAVHPGPPGRTGGAGVSPGRLFNEHVSVAIDTATGAIGEIAGGGGARIRAAGPGVNRFIYVPGTNPDSALYAGGVRVEAGEKGPLVASYVVTGNAPGCGSYRSEIRVVSGIDRVDLATTIDKRAVREKEGAHIAFPFVIPDAVFRYDVAGAIVTAGSGQLDGSCMNYFSVQSWADVSGPSSGVTWTTPDAPLVEMGGINAESPWLQSPRTSSQFFSYILNNYWHTNYKADQEGRMDFRYSLHPHGPFDPAQSVKWGRERRAPFLVRGGTDDPLPPLFTVEPPAVIAESVTPVDGGKGILVLLYNPSASPASVRLRWREGERVTISPSGPSGAATGPPADEFGLSAYGSRYLRAERER